jgi:hypothetical protein
MTQRSKARLRGVVITLEAPAHRRLKHLATDQDRTVLSLARELLIDGIKRAEAQEKRTGGEA